MKKTFFIFLLLLNLISSAWAQDSCEVGKVEQDIGYLYGDKECLEEFKLAEGSEGEALYCECLFKKSRNNVLYEVDASEQSQKAINKKNNAIDLARLKKMHRYLNYEVSFQETKFDMVKRDQAKVGCTPERMGEEFNRTAQKNDEETANSVSAKTADALKKLFSMIPGLPFWGGFAGEATQKPDAKPINRINFFNQDGQLNYLASKRIIGQVKDKILSNPDLTDAEKSTLKTIISNKKLSEEQLNQLASELESVNKRRQASDPNAKPIELDYQAVMKDLFKEEEEKIQNDFAKSHEKAISTSCIDYDNYKVFKSAPSRDLVNEWAGMSPAKIEEALNPKGVSSGEGFPLEFLQNNPVIAKNVITEGQRKDLAKMLFKFASANKGLSDVKKAENYIKFMREDIAQLDKNNKMVQLMQCDLLARNYVAATEGLAGVLQKNEGKDKIANNLRACYMRKSHSISGIPEKPSLKEILNANDLFTIFDFDSEIPTPENDLGYKTFLGKYCPGFEEVLNNSLTFGGCLLRNKKKCAERALVVDSHKRKRLLNEYYKNHPDARELAEMLKNNTNKYDQQEINKISETKYQDKAATDFYDKNLKPFLDGQSIFSKKNIFRPETNTGSSSGTTPIADAVNKVQESYNSLPNSAVAAADSPSTSASAASEVKSAAATSSAQGASVNPGQYIPPFLENKPAPKKQENTEKFSHIEEAKDLLEDYNNVPKEEKAELLSKTKEFLDTQDQTSQEIKDLQKKLSEYEQKFAPAVADNTPVPNRAPASVNMPIPTATNKVAPAAPLSFSQNGPASSASQAKVSSSITQSKAAASYERALNQANESKVDAKSLSLVVESGAVFDFNTSPLSRAEAPANMVIGTSLEPSDKLFAEISSDPEAMKAYLAKNLKEVPVDKVVSIKCKGDGCRPNSNEILLVITKESDNKFSIRSVSRETKVARSHRILDLKNELNKATR